MSDQTVYRVTVPAGCLVLPILLLVAFIVGVYLAYVLVVR